MSPISLVCALLVHVQVLGLLHPHVATISTARGKLQLRAVGETVHEGIGPPLPFLHIPAPGPHEPLIGIQTIRLKAPRRFPGALSVSAHAGELVFIDEAPLEDYVAQVVAAEMPGAPRAAQQALAVVARSFAVHAEQSPRGSSNQAASPGHSAEAPLCDTTHCQLYANANSSALKSAKAAAEATRDLVLLLPSGNVAPALHHAACGGRTATAKEIWPAASEDDELASAAVDDKLADGTPACASRHGDLPLQWRAELDEQSLATALGADLPLSLQIDRAPSGFVRALSIDGGKPLGPDALHLALGRALGWNRIRSSRIYWTDARSASKAETPDESADRTAAQVHSSPTRFVLRGSGFGHGVGLCQRGAARRAQSGESFRQILARYFPRLTVGRLPTSPNPG